jgi:Cu/Ag efflux pump CusA
MRRTPIIQPDDLRSKSAPQPSAIEVLFKPGTDPLRARQLVQERWQRRTQFADPGPRR